MRRLAVLAIGLIAFACSSDPYPLPAGPGASQSSPARVGVALPSVVLFVELRPGDRITFLGAEPIGLTEGADVVFYLSRPVHEANGDWLIGEQLEALPGTEASAVAASAATASRGFANTVGIVAELTAHKPGRYTLPSVRLRYRLNGGGERVGNGVSVVLTVCADDPAPKDCPSDEASEEP